MWVERHVPRCTPSPGQKLALGQSGGWGERGCSSPLPHFIPIGPWVPDLPFGQASAGRSKVLARQVGVCVGSLGTPSSGILFTMGVALAHPHLIYLQRQPSCPYLSI